MSSERCLRQHAYRLFVLAVGLALLGAAHLSRAANAQVTVEQPTIDIVAVDLSGRQTNLTHEPGWNVDPAVAGDGRVAFFSDRDGAGLYAMDGEGGNVRRLSGAVALGEDLAWSQASWSPAGDRIAFDGTYLASRPPCEQHCEGRDVLVIGADGSGAEQVAVDARAAAWSPDGRSLAYESDYDAYDEWARSVTITRLDGSRSVKVRALNTEGGVGPVWSPRGNQLAFQAHPIAGAPTWVYTVRADGTGERRLVRGHKPAWSPDGRRLAFIDDGKLFTINSGGTHERLLSRKGEFVVDGAWSPKGGTLAYIAGTEPAPGGAKNLRVETVSADRSHRNLLVRESAATLIWAGPVWTPDGKRILISVEQH
jgi:Tol biopolymer transport system component